MVRLSLARVGIAPTTATTVTQAHRGAVEIGNGAPAFA